MWQCSINVPTPRPQQPETSPNVKTLSRSGQPSQNTAKARNFKWRGTHTVDSVACTPTTAAIGRRLQTADHPGITNTAVLHNRKTAVLSTAVLQCLPQRFLQRLQIQLILFVHKVAWVTNGNSTRKQLVSRAIWASSLGTMSIVQPGNKMRQASGRASRFSKTFPFLDAV